jgi:2-oxoglutarate dehydrogenase E2 component (dihydrolipoamide succinyltransferase)
MHQYVNLPALGESVSEATVTRWLKRAGDRVEIGEAVVEVSTDKVDTEVVSPFAGVIETILVHEDETVDFGTALATIADGAESGAPAGG